MPSGDVASGGAVALDATPGETVRNPLSGGAAELPAVPRGRPGPKQGVAGVKNEGVAGVNSVDPFVCARNG